MPKITVLLTTYNCEDFLLPAITSVLKQNYTDYELVVIDDGSTDHTEELVKSIPDSRLIFHKNPKNSGIVYSLNKGLKIARGKYIARMDSDDLMLQNRLQHQFLFLEANPEYGMVGSAYQIIDDKGSFLQPVYPRTNNDEISLALLFGNQFGHPTVTMRSDLVKRLKYRNTFPYAEDYDLWCRLSKISKIGNLPDCYLSYRWHKNNTMNTRMDTIKSSLVQLLAQELDSFNIEYDTSELILHTAISLQLGKKYFNTDAKTAALEAWLNKIFRNKTITGKYEPIVIAKLYNEVKASALSQEH